MFVFGWEREKLGAEPRRGDVDSTMRNGAEREGDRMEMRRMYLHYSPDIGVFVFGL